MKARLGVGRVLGNLKRRAHLESAPAPAKAESDQPTPTPTPETSTAHSKAKTNKSLPNPVALAHADPSHESPEVIAARAIKQFCLAGGTSESGDEALFLPPIVDAAESSPTAAAECARMIRKYLGSSFLGQPAVQYNAFMLAKILSDYPGHTFTRNLDKRFVDATKHVLRNTADSSVRSFIMETLETMEARRPESDPGLVLLLSMWQREKEKINNSNGSSEASRWSLTPSFSAVQPVLVPVAYPHGAGGPAVLIPNDHRPPDLRPSSDAPSHSRARARRTPSHKYDAKLPPPAELRERMEEAQSIANLLQQMMASSSPAEITTNELIQDLANRCQHAARSIQAYMTSEDPVPDTDSMELLLDTNEQVQQALNHHRRALLNARRAEQDQQGQPDHPPSDTRPQTRSDARPWTSHRPPTSSSNDHPSDPDRTDWTSYDTSYGSVPIATYGAQNPSTVPPPVDPYLQTERNGYDAWGHPLAGSSSQPELNGSGPCGAGEPFPRPDSSRSDGRSGTMGRPDRQDRIGSKGKEPWEGTLYEEDRPPCAGGGHSVSHRRNISQGSHRMHSRSTSRTHLRNGSRDDQDHYQIGPTILGVPPDLMGHHPRKNSNGPSERRFPSHLSHGSYDSALADPYRPHHRRGESSQQAHPRTDDGNGNRGVSDKEDPSKRDTVGTVDTVSPISPFSTASNMAPEDQQPEDKDRRKHPLARSLSIDESPVLPMPDPGHRPVAGLSPTDLARPSEVGQEILSTPDKGKGALTGDSDEERDAHGMKHIMDREMKREPRQNERETEAIDGRPANGSEFNEDKDSHDQQGDSETYDRGSEAEDGEAGLASSEPANRTERPGTLTERPGTESGTLSDSQSRTRPESRSETPSETPSETKPETRRATGSESTEARIETKSISTESAPTQSDLKPTLVEELPSTEDKSTEESTEESTSQKPTSEIPASGIPTSEIPASGGLSERASSEKSTSMSATGQTPGQLENTAETDNAPADSLHPRQADQSQPDHSETDRNQSGNSQPSIRQSFHSSSFDHHSDRQDQPDHLSPTKPISDQSVHSSVGRSPTSVDPSSHVQTATSIESQRGNTSTTPLLAVHTAPYPPPLDTTPADRARDPNSALDPRSALESLTSSVTASPTSPMSLSPPATKSKSLRPPAAATASPVADPLDGSERRDSSIGLSLGFGFDTFHPGFQPATTNVTDFADLSDAFAPTETPQTQANGAQTNGLYTSRPSGRADHSSGTTERPNHSSPVTAHHTTSSDNARGPGTGPMPRLVTRADLVPGPLTSHPAMSAGPSSPVFGHDLFREYAQSSSSHRGTTSSHSPHGSTGLNPNSYTGPYPSSLNGHGGRLDGLDGRRVPQHHPNQNLFNQNIFDQAHNPNHLPQNQTQNTNINKSPFIPHPHAHPHGLGATMSSATHAAGTFLGTPGTHSTGHSIGSAQDPLSTPSYAWQRGGNGSSSVQHSPLPPEPYSATFGPSPLAHTPVSATADLGPSYGQNQGQTNGRGHSHGHSQDHGPSQHSQHQSHSYSQHVPHGFHHFPHSHHQHPQHNQHPNRNPDQTPATGPRSDDPEPLSAFSSPFSPPSAVISPLSPPPPPRGLGAGDSQTIAPTALRRNDAPVDSDADSDDQGEYEDEEEVLRRTNGLRPPRWR